MHKHKILVVEDDEGIREAIAVYLVNQGYDVLLANEGQEALALIAEHKIDCAIVDIMMPVMDGISFTLAARKQQEEFPILFLSAKSEEIDKITGLNIGADDYITKPFTSMELVARVKAHLRRYDRLLDLKKGPVAAKQGIYEEGDLIVNDNSKEVFVNDVIVKLTPREYDILLCLIKEAGRVFSMQQIYEQVWPNDKAVNNETIMVHIRNLREKIEIDPSKPRYIKVVWGVGYKFERNQP